MEKKKCKSKEEAYEALACQVMKELNTQDMQAFLLTHRLIATPCTDLGALWVKMYLSFSFLCYYLSLFFSAFFAVTYFFARILALICFYKKVQKDNKHK